MTAGLGGQPVRSRSQPRSLLERLRADDLKVPLRSQDAISDRITSIESNLLRVLNGRAGESASTPGFGLIDMNDAAVGSRDLLAAISRDISRAIAEGEARVFDVEVIFDRADNRGMELLFSIQAKTLISHRNEQISIDLVIREGRHFAAR
ncbi:type VI secretion system baseplate subunit TssE [Roseinatronobacter monicus]|uniref:Type VI secretion system protein n=1 Tax=Roseinatronobacter monicus TaxID=393481 RepID=A0A543K4L2_9RHOB|nr:type VI secretion system baseplate subunit TssE [Roseinatronobacter monicus]TQM89974.1 type VI secretion system protein [Roseinatronobacter monicus]